MSPAPIILLLAALAAAAFMLLEIPNNRIVPIVVMAFGVLAGAIALFSKKHR